MNWVVELMLIWGKKLRGLGVKALLALPGQMEVR